MNASEDPPPQPFRGLPFLRRWPMLAGALSGLLLRLVFSGKPGEVFGTMLGSFIFLVPVAVAAVTVYLAERRARHRWTYHVFIGMGANVLFVIGSFVVLIEGLICAILVLPLFAIIGGVSGALMGLVCRLTNWPRQTVLGVVVLPLLLGGVEPQWPLPVQVHSVERVRLIAAAPEPIWRQLENARDIQPEEVGSAWMYRIGAPTPTAGVLADTPEGKVRHVTMGRGVRFDQVAVQWEPNRHVRWTYRFAEDSFPPQALDDHVRIGGHYFDLLDTDYTLVPHGEQTELHIRMRYRVSTRFNWYAQPIAQWLIGNFEEVILGFYARRAEAAATIPPTIAR